MVQPVDYTRGQQQFDYLGLMNLLQQQQQQGQQQERQQAFSNALQQGQQAGNLDYQALMSQFPKQQQFLINMQNQGNLQTQLQQTNAGADAVNLYRALDRGDTAGAQAIIEQNANDINSLGDPSFTAQTALEMLQNNPEQLKNTALNIATMAGGQEAFLESIASGQTPMTEYQQAMIAQKGVDQELRRLELEDKKLDRQYDRAKSDLDRLKLQGQIDEVQRKKTEALEAKEKNKSEAIATTQQFIYTF